MSDPSPPPRDRSSPDRSAPDVERGPRRELGPRARGLVERAQGTDRASAARERMERVRAHDDRVRRWRRASRNVAWGVATVGTTGLGALVGGWLGAGVGAGLLVLVFGLQQGVARAARRRGASAWDWQARRYRFLGNPSERVRDLDVPDGRTDRDPFTR